MARGYGSQQISGSFDTHQLAATFQSAAESEEKCRPTRLMFGCNGLFGWNDLIRSDDLVSIFTAFRVEEFQFVAGGLSGRKDGQIVLPVDSVMHTRTVDHSLFAGHVVISADVLDLDLIPSTGTYIETKMVNLDVLVLEAVCP